MFRLLGERDPLTFTEHPIGGPLRQRVTAEAGILHSPAEAPPLLWGSALLQSLESALFLSRDFQRLLGRQCDISIVVILAACSSLSLYSKFKHGFLPSALTQQHVLGTK